ncbi:MAG: hypothetical protein SF182_19950 [Deltaproteobacteria bacterium]|nr:hypothetical protein [Deltaproteobacteria bacterium]
MRTRFLPPLAVGAATLAYLWAYPLAIGRADESHFLFEARRVLDGEVPYRDFFESLTPLGFYWLAALYALAGTTLRTARAGIALVDAAAALLLFQLARRVAGWPEALLATLAFVCLALPVWPYASPHWLSTALGLATAAVVLAPRWQASWGWRPLLAGLLAGAAFGVQQQRGAFLALWLPCAWAVLGAALPRAARWRTVVGATLASGAGALLVVVPLLAHAAWRASWAGLFDMVFGFALEHYGPTHSGRTAWAAVLMLTQMHAAATWLWLLRVAPLLVAVEAVLLARDWRRGATPATRAGVVLALLALWMGLSIAYLPDFIHVAFVLPFLLLPAAALVHRLRALPMPAARRAAQLGLGLAALAVAAQGAINLRAAHAAAPRRFVSAGFGALDGDGATQRLYDAVQRHLVHDADGRARLYSYPNEAWLYLALPAENVTPYSLLVANMFPREDIERVIATLRARQPGTVVLWLPFAGEVAGAGVPPAIEAGYDAVEEVDGFRIYTRRGAAPEPGA